MNEQEPKPVIKYDVLCENHGLLETASNSWNAMAIISEHVIEYRECFGKTKVIPKKENGMEGAVVGFNLP